MPQLFNDIQLTSACVVHGVAIKIAVAPAKQRISENKTR